MKQITIGSTRYGPFDDVKVLEDRYRGVRGEDAVEMQFTVVGQGIIEPWDATPEPPPVPSAAEFEQALDAHFDTIAQSDRWDNRFTLMVRAGFPNLWREKAIAFGTWVDECNVFAIDLLGRVMAGEAPPPATIEAFIAMLPPAPDMTSQALKGAHS